MDVPLPGRAGKHGRATPADRYTGAMQLQRADIRVIPAHENRRVRWKNGLGWTREIARVPADRAHDLAWTQADRSSDDEWDWRLSVAEIEQDSAFSMFPGIDRELVLLSGNGLRLRFADGSAIELLPPHGAARFAGEEAVIGELIDGRTTDFNLMWRRDAVAATLWRRPLAGAMVVFADPGDTWVVHVIAGSAGFADGSPHSALQPGDTALIAGHNGRARCVLEGAGEALLIRLARPSNAAIRSP